MACRCLRKHTTLCHCLVDTAVSGAALLRRIIRRSNRKIPGLDFNGVHWKSLGDVTGGVKWDTVVTADRLPTLDSEHTIREPQLLDHPAYHTVQGVKFNMCFPLRHPSLDPIAADPNNLRHPGKTLWEV
jgi:hypothetical protein